MVVPIMLAITTRRSGVVGSLDVVAVTLIDPPAGSFTEPTGPPAQGKRRLNPADAATNPP
jgi:hypothetical protein